MSGGASCHCGNRNAWRVAVRNANYSMFSGGHRTPSDYSEVVCAQHLGGCGRSWRTKAKYVVTLPDGDDCPRCGGAKTYRKEVDDPNAPLGFRLVTTDCEGCLGTGEGRAR